MNNNALALGNMAVLRLDMPYIATPANLYAALCHQRPYSLLLESAEIDSKQDLKSLMLIDAAVRIVCRGRHVELQANSANGINLLNAVEAEITRQQSGFTSTRSTALLSLDFAEENRVVDEDARLQQPSPFDALRLIQQAFVLDNLPNEALLIGGLFSYDLVAQFEPLPDIAQGSHCPDYVFYVAETLLIIDHQQRETQLQATQFGGENNDEINGQLTAQLQHIKNTIAHPPAPSTSTQQAPSNIEVSVSDDEFCSIVTALKKYIINGDVFQVVPSRRFILPCPSPFNAYVKLKQGNPSPYMFYMQDKEFTLFGASPESALKYSKETNQVEIYPIAGTRPRGKNTDGSINFDLDARIELELRNDSKENAEHMMLVDLARNDIARISEPGTRYVADLLKVDRYSHVMHLVSRVIGQLRAPLDALHAYQACMNMGTLTGAPKIRAMQLIRQFEQDSRGSYGGAVGYITGHGDMDTCIVIRSAYVENGIAQVQAGAGVVFDSVPQAETDETRAKAQAVLTAIIAANSGDNA